MNNLSKNILDKISNNCTFYSVDTLFNHIKFEFPFFLEELDIIKFMKEAYLSQHCANFDIITALFDLNVCEFVYSDFVEKEHETNDLKTIVEDKILLYAKLKCCPKLVLEQDDDGKTLLHHSINLCNTMGKNISYLIYHMLLNNKYLDFSIKDNNGITPIHQLAYMCENKEVCKFLFPIFIKEAYKRGYDWSTTDGNGQAIIHIVSRISYHDYFFGRVNNIEKLLKLVPLIDINQTSSSGSTAFYYTINWLNLNEANTLLKNKADPHLYKKDDRNPIKEIDNKINELKINMHFDYVNKLLDLKTMIKKYNNVIVI